MSVDRNKTLAYILSTLVIGLLILAGPAQGFSLDLTLDNSSPNTGDIITFTAEIDIPSGERLPIEELTLEISGPETISCQFNPDGTIISGCNDLTISLIQNPGYGHGYGYGYFGYGYNFGYGYGHGFGKLIYKITFDTSNYPSGTYTTKLVVKINELTFSKVGNTLTINLVNDGGTNQVNSESGGCRTDWQCSEWSICTNGQQTRTCDKIRNFCYAGKAPEQTRSCTEEFEPLTNQIGQDNSIELNPEEEVGEPFVSRITGAAIGVLGNAISTRQGIVMILIMTSIIVALGIVIWMKRVRYPKSTVEFKDSFY